MSRGPETSRKAPASPVLRRSLAAWVALVLAAGCQHQNASLRGVGDPLVSSTQVASPPVLPAAPATPAASGVPSLPATTSATALGTLASGAAPSPTPDSPRNDLRTGSGAPGVPTSNPAPAAAGPPTAGWPQNGLPPPPVSALQAPEATGGVSRLSPVAATPGPTAPFAFASSGQSPAFGTAAQADAYHQLQEMLRARGVTWQRLESWGDAGEWKFRCSIPDPKNHNIGRNYEARAVGDYGLAAIRAVIERIDLEKHGAPAPSR
jgi:hypothetical protein